MDDDLMLQDNGCETSTTKTISTESSSSNENSGTEQTLQLVDDAEQNELTEDNDSNDEEGNKNDDLSMSDSDSESYSEEDLDYIDNMLEEGLKGKRKHTDSQSSPQHEEKKRIVLIKRDPDHFEVLPEGWVEITHFSGMPIYLHKQSRVCTLSKPYHLGQSSARKHDVPRVAVPCLQYRQELEKEKKMLNSLEVSNVTEPSDLSRFAKVEVLKESKKQCSLDYMALREYCQNLFEFKTVTIRKFKTWADRRKHTQMKKMAQRPSLPESTRLITCTVPKVATDGESPSKVVKKEFVMNPAGKSAVCILHEFVQHTDRTQPKYIFHELENVSKPYCATVIINGREYGKGYGSSKKEAKAEAAHASLVVLIPDFKNVKNEPEPIESADLEFFDNIRIEDVRVADLCSKVGQFSPYQVLVECLKRHYGLKDMDIKTEVKLLKHQKNEYKMKVGSYQATVLCKNKREGKQRAAQSILKSLHPKLDSWGALLRLYGRGSCKTLREKKEESLEITELQNFGCANRPNLAILNKLREEMLKLENEQGANDRTMALPINSIHMPNLEEPAADESQ